MKCSSSSTLYGGFISLFTTPDLKLFPLLPHLIKSILSPSPTTPYYDAFIPPTQSTCNLSPFRQCVPHKVFSPPVSSPRRRHILPHPTDGEQPPRHTFFMPGKPYHIIIWPPTMPLDQSKQLWNVGVHWPIAVQLAGPVYLHPHERGLRNTRTTCLLPAPKMDCVLHIHSRQP